MDDTSRQLNTADMLQVKPIEVHNLQNLTVK